jgi:uncharacterized protein
MKIQAFQCRSFKEAFISFSSVLRMNGFNIGIRENEDCFSILVNYGLTNQKFVFESLKSLYCKSPEEIRLYEVLFHEFWISNPTDLRPQKNVSKTQGIVKKKTNSSLVIVGQGKSVLEQEEAKQVSGANETERLKKTDLNQLNYSDSEQLEKIAKRLYKQMANRMKRRAKMYKDGEKLDLRKIIRQSISYGGEPIQKYFKKRKIEKKRLLIFLDISGSMDKYSYYLLQFILVLKDNFRQVEAFLFSTKLQRISKVIQLQNLHSILETLTNTADHWSGGTKIGDSLAQFNDFYGKRMLNGSPIVIIMSDGLDSSQNNSLGEELKLIQNRSKKIIWLNPLKGMKDYQPTAKGMSEALPSINNFISSHNLESILELEQILNNA